MWKAWISGDTLLLACHNLTILRTAPPATVTLIDELGPELGTVLQAVELSFDCDFSNVLLVNIKWSVYSSSCTSCTVDMTPDVSCHYKCMYIMYAYANCTIMWYIHASTVEH